MKCNIRREEMRKEKVYKCCFCGKEITVLESNNPEPVREHWTLETGENRCCHRCNEKIVIPSRFACGYARTEQELNNCIRNLQNMSYEELKILFKVDDVA